MYFIGNPSAFHMKTIVSELLQINIFLKIRFNKYYSLVPYIRSSIILLYVLASPYIYEILTNELYILMTSIENLLKGIYNAITAYPREVSNGVNLYRVFVLRY